MGEPGKRVVAVANLREFFKDSVHGALAKQHVCGRGADRAVRRQPADAVRPLGGTLWQRRLRARACSRSPSCCARRSRRRAPAHASARCSVSATCRCSSPASSHAASPPPHRHRLSHRHGRARLWGARRGERPHGSRRTLAAVFAELAQKFQPLVDALNEVSESAYTHSDRDILRLYEIWLKTGSARCHALLARLGVDPTRAGGLASRTRAHAAPVAAAGDDRRHLRCARGARCP